MPIPTLKPIPKFAEDSNGAFTTPALYDIRFRSKPRYSSKDNIVPNGFAPAFVTRGRRVYVWVEKFYEILMNQQAA